MSNGHGLRNFLLGVVGLIVAGVVAWWLIGALLHVLFYIVVGAIVVGGAVFLYGRAKRSLTGGSRRGIGR